MYIITDFSRNLKKNLCIVLCVAEMNPLEEKNPI